MAIPRLVRIVCVLIAGLAGGTFHAQSLEAARLAYVEGDFLQAADIAGEFNTADAHALAAESLAIYGFHLASENEQEEIFARATDHGLEAVRLEPENVNAHLQLAHAMGRYAQVVGVIEVLGNGYVRRVRNAVQTAIEMDSESALAHLGLAVWHAEALDKAGIFARILFGASSARALTHLERALELAPDSKVVTLESGLGFLLLSERRYGDRAQQLLLKSRSIPIQNAWEGFMHETAVEMLEELGES